MKRGIVKKGSKYGTKRTALNHGYKYYKSKYSVRSKFNLDQARYSLIVQLLTDAIFKELLKGTEIILPSRIGSLQIVKYRKKGEGIDFHNSIKYGEKIKYLNLHSGGYSATLRWFKKTANFKYKTMWSLNLTKNRKSRKPESISRHLKKYGAKNFPLLNYK